MAVGETTKLRASAAGIASRELTLTMRSKVRVEVARRRDGSAVVTGTTDPKLPGRVLWLRSNAVTPSARTGASDGRFRLTLRRPRRGRCQAVFIPSGARAERATSNRSHPMKSVSPLRRSRWPCWPSRRGVGAPGRL